MRIGTGIIGGTKSCSFTIPILVVAALLVIIVIPLVIMSLSTLLPKAVNYPCASTFWPSFLENSSFVYRIQWGWIPLVVSLFIAGWAVVRRLYVLRITDLPSSVSWTILALPLLSFLTFTMDWTQIHSETVEQLQRAGVNDLIIESNRDQLSTTLQEAGIFVASPSQSLDLIRRARFRAISLLDRFPEGPLILFSHSSRRPLTDACKERIELEITGEDENGYAIRRFLEVSAFVPLEEPEVWPIDSSGSWFTKAGARVIDVMSGQVAAIGASALYFDWFKIFVIQCIPILLILLVQWSFNVKLLKIKGG